MATGSRPTEHLNDEAMTVTDEDRSRWAAPLAADVPEIARPPPPRANAAERAAQASAQADRADQTRPGNPCAAPPTVVDTPDVDTDIDIECGRCLAVILPGDQGCAQCGAARPTADPSAAQGSSTAMPGPVIVRTPASRPKVGRPAKRIRVSSHPVAPSTDAIDAATENADMAKDAVEPSPTAGMQPTKSALRSGAPPDRDRRRIAFKDDNQVVPIVSYRDVHLWWSPSELGKVQTTASRDTTWSSRPRGRPPKGPGPATPASAKSSTPPIAAPRQHEPPAPLPPRAVSTLDDPDEDPMDHVNRDAAGGVSLPNLGAEPQLTPAQLRLAALRSRVRAKQGVGVG